MSRWLGYLFLLSALFSASPSLLLYEEQREALIRENDQLSFSFPLALSAQEELVSSVLEQRKKEALNQLPMAPTSFFLVRDTIVETPLYTFLQRMPKGALLHVHSGALVPLPWVIKELTTLPHCYVYWKEEGDFLKGTLHFFLEGKAPEGFLSTEELRSSLPDFDVLLLSLLTLPSNSQEPWKDFEESFTRITGLLYYKEAFFKYYLRALEGLWEDHVRYLELRVLQGTLYDLQKDYQDPTALIEEFIKVQACFQEKHPDFHFSLIYAHERDCPSEEEKWERLKEACYLRSLYPHFILGYDLVGEENKKAGTLSYVPLLLQAQELAKSYGTSLPFYLHDGESLLSSNQNLYDAVLLSCKRIGHGLNLFFFPVLQERIRQQKICLELCPISNQALGYVSDLRLHPAIAYLRNGLCCTLNSDDPALFGYEGVSCDFWQATLAWDLSLRDLKQLCLNSLIYSGLQEKEKEEALRQFTLDWHRFLEEVAPLESLPTR